MFFNVVVVYTYINYTDAITWPFIRLINACQCLWRADKILATTVISTEGGHAEHALVRRVQDGRLSY